MRYPEFLTIWQGRWQGIYRSHSEADLAFCRMIQQSGGSRQDADYFMRMSNLMREKWDKKHGNCTYGELTLRVVYTDGDD
jgi:primase-polymerase (primpol)-like protein